MPDEKKATPMGGDPVVEGGPRTPWEKRPPRNYVRHFIKKKEDALTPRCPNACSAKLHHRRGRFRAREGPRPEGKTRMSPRKTSKKLPLHCVERSIEKTMGRVTSSCFLEWYPYRHQESLLVEEKLGGENQIALCVQERTVLAA